MIYAAFASQMSGRQPTLNIFWNGYLTCRHLMTRGKNRWRHRNVFVWKVWRTWTRFLLDHGKAGSSSKRKILAAEKKIQVASTCWRETSRLLDGHAQQVMRIVRVTWAKDAAVTTGARHQHIRAAVQSIGCDSCRCRLLNNKRRAVHQVKPLFICLSERQSRWLVDDLAERVRHLTGHFPAASVSFNHSYSNKEHP